MIFERLSQKDKHTLKVGAFGAAAILIFAFVISPFFESWQGIRSELKTAKEKLTLLDSTSAGDAVVAAIVPSFQIPQPEETQRLLFKRKFNEQLKKAGVNIKNLQFVSSSKLQRALGFKLLRLQCRGKCRFSQLLDLIAALNENPYLVGIEDIQFRINPKKPTEIELSSLTVSTFAR